jgi:hypothetical protein
MKITKKWLKDKKACNDAFKKFLELQHKLKSDKQVINTAMKLSRFDWSNWVIVRLMNKKQKVQYAVFAAELVLKVFENKYPDDKRPREAVEAAKNYIKRPSKKTKKDAAAANAAYAAYAAANAANAAYAAYAAANAANAAYAAAANAAYAAYAAANAAYAAAAANAAANAANAAYAAYAAANAAYAAAYAAAAANAANAANAAYAAAAKIAIQKKIIKNGIKILNLK